MVRFVTSYADSIRSSPDADKLVASLVGVLELALTTGESFLPDARPYDDLFYKILESGDILVRFQDAYGLGQYASTAGGIEVLLSVSGHYKQLVEEKKGKGNKNISPREIAKIIKEGYETLTLEAKQGQEQWRRYREADYRNFIKKVTRMAVTDLKTLLDQRT